MMSHKSQTLCHCTSAVWDNTELIHLTWILLKGTVYGAASLMRMMKGTEAVWGVLKWWSSETPKKNHGPFKVLTADVSSTDVSAELQKVKRFLNILTLQWQSHRLKLTAGDKKENPRPRCNAQTALQQHVMRTYLECYCWVIVHFWEESLSPSEGASDRQDTCSCLTVVIDWYESTLLCHLSFRQIFHLTKWNIFIIKKTWIELCDIKWLKRDQC